MASDGTVVVPDQAELEAAAAGPSPSTAWLGCILADGALMDGDVVAVLDGQPTAEACCRACRANQRCNVRPARGRGRGGVQLATHRALCCCGGTTHTPCLSLSAAARARCRSGTIASRRRAASASGRLLQPVPPCSGRALAWRLAAALPPGCACFRSPLPARLLCPPCLQLHHKLAHNRPHHPAATAAPMRAALPITGPPRRRLAAHPAGARPRRAAGGGGAHGHLGAAAAGVRPAAGAPHVWLRRLQLQRLHPVRPTAFPCFAGAAAGAGSCCLLCRAATRCLACGDAA